jgi:hypothetical protein
MRAKAGAVRKPALTVPVFRPTRELWPPGEPEQSALKALTGIEVVEPLSLPVLYEMVLTPLTQSVEPAKKTKSRI